MVQEKFRLITMVPTDQKVVRKFANKQKVVSSADGRDRLQSVWNSMSVEKKESLLKVSVDELKKHLDSSKDDSVKKDVLLEALSFVQINKTFKFWICCCCNVNFSDSESHIQHVRTKHIGNLKPEDQEILPQEVESNISNVDETHIDTQNSDVSERIVLADGFLHLLLDDRLLRSSCSETDATETSVLAGDCEGGVFADGDALLSSIFTGSATAEQWTSWKRQKEEKTEKGMDVFLMIEKEFSNLEGFLQNKHICLRYTKALEGMESSEAALEEQMKLLEEQKQLVEVDKIKLEKISEVLKEARSISFLPQPNQNDTGINKNIQSMKDKYSAKLSEIDASIIRSVTIRKKLEFKLASHSSHDYQTLMLLSVKTFIQAQLEDLAEKGVIEKSDAAAKALLAELELEENNSKQIQEKSENEKKKRKKKNNKKKKGSEVGGGMERLNDEETAEQGDDFPIGSDQDSNQKIGVGGKPQMLSLAERYQQSSNSGDDYRNLGENELGGVIFGCTSDTFNECLLNQIFGLPIQHFTYVKNIKSGLPLFLFNYSNMKLHGIYEAASSGQMNINPYAWNADNSETQKFPAQVSIKIRKECQPLSKHSFKPIIKDNYYGGDPEELFEPIIENNYYGGDPEELFKFELDHAQASELISLFESPSPTMGMGSTSTVSRVPKDAPIHESKDSLASISKADTDAPSAYLEVESGNPHDAYKSKSVDPDPNSRNEQGAKILHFPFLGPYSISVNEGNQMLESHSEKEEVICPNVNGEEEGVVDVPHEKNHTASEEEEDDSSSEAPLVSSSDHKNEDIPNNNSSNLQSLVNQLRKDNGKLYDLLAENEKKWVEFQDELHQLKGRVTQLESQLSTSIREPFDDGELRLGVDELIFILGGSDSISWISGSALDCYSPSRNIIKSLKRMSCARCYAASATLCGQIYIFGGAFPWTKTLYDIVESYNPLGNEWTFRPSLLEKKGHLAGVTMHNKVYAIGGQNGTNYLSDVEMFNPCTGKWTFAPSMRQRRACPTAVELNGAIYVVGGHIGSNCLESAERFDPREDSWSWVQPMNTRRGWHSLAVLNEKLYAMGGFDGSKSEVVPTVDVFDPRRGAWIQGDEMKEARMGFGSAVLGEAIYAWGGCDQNSILLDTVECYKEGQGWRLTNSKGVSKKAYFTTAVL